MSEVLEQLEVIRHYCWFNSTLVTFILIRTLFYKQITQQEKRSDIFLMVQPCYYMHQHCWFLFNAQRGNEVKKKKLIKLRGGYQGWNEFEVYWGNFFKWLKLKRRGWIKWKREIVDE